MRPARASSESPRIHRVDRADAGTGEHRIGRFRDHRHVDRDAITLFHAMLLYDVRHAADTLLELVIGDLLVDIRVAAFPDDGDRVAMRLGIPVDAIVGKVGGPSSNHFIETLPYSSASATRQKRFSLEAKKEAA